MNVGDLAKPISRGMARQKVGLFRRQLSITALLKLFLSPLIGIAVLVVAANVMDDGFQGPYVVLGLIAFSLTFPGTWPETNLMTLWGEFVLPWFITIGILFLFGFGTGYLWVFPAEVITAWALVTPFATFIAHKVVRRLLPRLLELEGGVRRAVIAGANGLGQQLAAELAMEPGVILNGYFDDRAPSRVNLVDGKMLLGNLRDLIGYARAGEVDVIYITLPMASQPRILKLLDELRDTTVSIYFVPDIFVSDLIQARIDSIHGIPTLAVCETPLYGVNGVVKRISDIVLSGLFLLLLGPFMLAIAAGVKYGSPGPILFRQRRYGLDGREIVVFKFRSMTVCEDGDSIRQAQVNDQRVTPFGAFLRRTSLDELPQLINVLQGSMSIVGPRPHAVAHNEMYRKLVKGYMIRHKVKPGITGWAQINGLRGETDTVEKMEARIRYDIDYLRHWSLAFDLMILLKTAFVVLKQRNAY